MTIEEVIRRGLFEPLSLESGAMPTASQIHSAAKAVRDFLLSDEVRHRVARALHGLDNNDDLWLPGWFDVEARAALSSITGDE